MRLVLDSNEYLFAFGVAGRPAALALFDTLVSENRHFLTRHKGLPFRVVTAEQCLPLLKT